MLGKRRGRGERLIRDIPVVEVSVDKNLRPDESGQVIAKIEREGWDPRPRTDDRKEVSYRIGKHKVSAKY